MGDDKICLQALTFTLDQILRIIVKYILINTISINLSTTWSSTHSASHLKLSSWITTTLQEVFWPHFNKISPRNLQNSPDNSLEASILTWPSFSWGKIFKGVRKITLSTILDRGKTSSVDYLRPPIMNLTALTKPYQWIRMATFNQLTSLVSICN